MEIRKTHVKNVQIDTSEFYLTYIIVTICTTEVLFTLQVLLIL